MTTTSIPSLRPADVRTPGPAGSSEPRHALIDHPSEAIGDVRCAWSDLDLQGRSLDGVSRDGFPIARAIGWGMMGAMVGAVVGVATIVLGGGGITMVLAIMSCALLAAAMSWSRHAAQRGAKGSCFYVGTRGVERVDLFGGKLTRHAVLYADVAHVLSASHRVWYGGQLVGDVERVVFVDAKLQRVFAVEALCRPGAALGPETWGVREVGEAALVVRVPLAIARLARGEPLRCPIVGAPTPSGVYRIASNGLQLTAERVLIELPGSTISSPKLVELWTSQLATVTVREGHLELEPADPHLPGASIPRDTLADADLVHALLATSISARVVSGTQAPHHAYVPAGA